MIDGPRPASTFRGGGGVEDQLAIRELIERYADACCTRDDPFPWRAS